eukprot:SAG31_NODE_2455_length_5664_cov_1.921294_5_plen_82_part_00
MAVQCLNGAILQVVVEAAKFGTDDWAFIRICHLAKAVAHVRAEKYFRAQIGLTAQLSLPFVRPTILFSRVQRWTRENNYII